MVQRKKPNYKDPPARTDTRKKGLSPDVHRDGQEKTGKFILFVVCCYLLFAALAWLFFTCLLAIKIIICLLGGLIITFLLIILVITSIKLFGIEFKFIILHRKLFSIIMGLCIILVTYIYAFTYPFVNNFYLQFAAKCNCNCIDIKLKLVPAGEYNIGVSDIEESRITDLFPNGGTLLFDEKPQHKVLLDSFYISEFEISKYIYSCYAKEKNIDFSYSSIEKLQPLTNISWFEAIDFCAWLSGKTGLNVDLPTEAQWEVAAGSGLIYPWGDHYPEKSNCNFNSTYQGPTPVDSINNYSSLGVINMAGNVSEWCLDWYEPYSVTSNNKNPKGPNTGTRKVVRGGSWKDNAFDIRVSRRKSFPANIKTDYIGLRIIIKDQLNNGGKNYENQNVKFIDSRNAVIIINGM